MIYRGCLCVDIVVTNATVQRSPESESECELRPVDKDISLMGLFRTEPVIVARVRFTVALSLQLKPAFFFLISLIEGLVTRCWIGSLIRRDVKVAENSAESGKLTTVDEIGGLLGISGNAWWRSWLPRRLGLVTSGKCRWWFVGVASVATWYDDDGEEVVNDEERG